MCVVALATRFHTKKCIPHQIGNKDILRNNTSKQTEVDSHSHCSLIYEPKIVYLGQEKGFLEVPLQITVCHLLLVSVQIVL